MVYAPEGGTNYREPSARQDEGKHDPNNELDDGPGVRDVTRATTSVQPIIDQTLWNVVDEEGTHGARGADDSVEGYQPRGHDNRGSLPSGTSLR